MKLKSLFSFKATVIEPCSKLLSKFKKRKPSSIKIRPRKRSSRMRTKAVKFKKSLGFSQCRPKTKKRSEKTSRTQRKKTTNEQVKKPVPKVRVAELMTVLFSLRKAKEIEKDDEGIHTTMDDPTTIVGKKSFSSSITPIFARSSSASTKKSDSSRSSSKKEEIEEGIHTTMEDPTTIVGKLSFSSTITPLFARNSSASSKKEETSDSEDVEESCRKFEKYLVEMVVEQGELKDLKDVEELVYCWKNLKTPIFIELVSRFYGQQCKDLFSHTH